MILAFVALDVIFLGYVFLKRKRLSATDQKKYAEYWRTVSSDTNYSRAVINADKLLDKLLAKKGYGGSLGEKLKKAGKLFGDLDGVWSAHKLRNRIAHEMEGEVSPREAKTALKQFERAFRDLGLQI